jgi:hypothetical protein
VQKFTFFGVDGLRPLDFIVELFEKLAKLLMVHRATPPSGNRNEMELSPLSFYNVPMPYTNLLNHTLPKVEGVWGGCGMGRDPNTH